MSDTRVSGAQRLLRGETAHAISDLMVRVLTEYTGRGPTQARTYIYDDLITIVLHDQLTKGERSLLRDGELEHVLETRRKYQQTMRPVIVAGVEALTARHVIAFLSDNHVDPDVAVENLLLEPLIRMNGASAS